MIATLMFVQVIVQVLLMMQVSSIITDGVETGDMSVVEFIGIKMIVLTVMCGICMVIINRLASGLIVKITCGIRQDLFSRVMSLSQSDFDRMGGSTLMTRITTDTSYVQTFFNYILGSALNAPIMVTILILAAMWISPVLCIILLIPLIVMMVVFYIRCSNTIPMFMTIQERLDVLNDSLREKFDGARTIRAFGRQDHEMRKFEEKDLDFRGSLTNVNVRLYYLTPVSFLVMNLALLVIYYIGSGYIIAGAIGVQDLILFSQFIVYFIASLSIMPFVVKTLPRTTVAARRLEELLRTENTMDVTESNKVPVDGDIEFRDVSVVYPDGTMALTDINFTMRKGEVTAIIGSTGSGKTTLVNLINRTFDPTSGQVLLDGTDVRELDPGKLRDSISLAEQCTMVIHDTVYENITLGSNFDRGYVEEICHKTGFSKVLDRMSDGLDTPLVQGGMNLSGGQRQLMSVMRALVKDAWVYVFDDCFTAMDAKTEANLRSSIMEHVEGKTVLLVAERTNVVRNADRIIVIDGGRVVAQGTHQSLLDECELYREFDAVQSYLLREGRA